MAMRMLRTTLRGQQEAPLTAPSRAAIQSVKLGSHVVKFVPEIVVSARKALATGKLNDVAERKNVLKGLYDILEENEELFHEALQHDLTKSRGEMQLAELETPKGEIALALQNIDKWAKPRKISTKLTDCLSNNYVLPEPKGLVLVMSSWNMPLHTLLSPMVGAVAAGNGVVAKPSEYAPATSNLLVSLFPKYLDSDLFPVIAGGVEVSSKILEQPFDHIFFTGSSSHGRDVMMAAANHLCPVTLELGGKCPAIVTAGANVATAAKRIIWSKTLNLGQSCVAPDYCLVEKGLMEPLLEQMEKSIVTLFGQDQKTSASLGRIVNERNTRRLGTLLEEPGLNIVFGGGYDVSENYVQPTLVKNPPMHSALWSQEILGPILPVLAVDDVDSAIKFVKDRDKPLAIYAFGASDKVRRVMTETSSGMVVANDANAHYLMPNVPRGGIGQSGMGGYGGRHTFDTFSNLKSTVKRPRGLDFLNFARYPPFTASKLHLMEILFPKIDDNFLMRLIR